MQDIYDCTEKSDTDLVRLTLANAEWYACLVERYQQRLMRYIRRISRSNQQDAEDILQEVFINAYRNLNAFDQSLSFSSWIYRITRNAVISNHRKIKARVQLVGGDGVDRFLAMVRDDNDVHETVRQRIDGAQVQKAVEQLDSKYAEILVLRYFEELEYQEISDIIKKPIGSVGTRINRAKKQLRTILTREGMTL